LPAFAPSVIRIAIFGRMPPDVPSVAVPSTSNVLGVVDIRVSENESV
jgi:hypothetical protein